MRHSKNINSKNLKPPNLVTLSHRRHGDQGRRTIGWTDLPRQWSENASSLVSTPTQRSADSWTCVGTNKAHWMQSYWIIVQWIYIKHCRWNCSLCQREREAWVWTWWEQIGSSSSMQAGTPVMTLRLCAGCTGIWSYMTDHFNVNCNNKISFLDIR